MHLFILDMKSQKSQSSPYPTIGGAVGGFVVLLSIVVALNYHHIKKVREYVSNVYQLNK